MNLPEGFMECLTYIKIDGILDNKNVPRPSESLIDILTTTFCREALKQGLKRLRASWFCWGWRF